MNDVITRFAPSPTGYLHIGGCRTALFNWIYAKKHEGQFLLRIEDTDENRSVPEAVEAIISGLEWLGIKHNGEIVFQSKRKSRHVEVAYELLERGMAYWCGCPPKKRDLTGMQVHNSKVSKCKCRDMGLSKSDNFVIRFASPKNGNVSYNDIVYGEIETPNSEIEDLVILRSNESPTYMLAVVVDDHDMGVTHVIRGNDHITNTPKQILLYKALGWNIPSFAHLPLLHGEDGKKLSKRHGATDINEYKVLALPESMRNYLLRLGWGSGDTEIINDKTAVELFDLSGIGLSPARLDHKKLADINKYYIQIADDDKLIDVVTFCLTSITGAQLNKNQISVISRAIPLFKNRGGANKEFAESMLFLITDIDLDDESVSTIRDNIHVLQAVVTSLSCLSIWTKDSILCALKALGLQLATIYKVSRSSVVGRMNAPSIIDIMELMTQEVCVARMKRALEIVNDYLQR